MLPPVPALRGNSEWSDLLHVHRQRPRTRPPPPLISFYNPTASAPNAPDGHAKALATHLFVPSQQVPPLMELTYVRRSDAGDVSANSVCIVRCRQIHTIQVSLNTQALPHMLDRKNYEQVITRPFRLCFQNSPLPLPFHPPSLRSTT
jgi:hypothetical protein